MDDREYDQQIDPLTVPGVSNMGLSGGQIPGSFGTTGRGPRLLTGGGPRATAISTASTIVVIAALVAVFWLAPGSAQVRHTFFDPRDMWQSFIGNPKQGYYSVGAAIWLNIRMFLAAEVLILVLALVLALIRQSTSPVLYPLRVLGIIYVDFFRGVPLLLVILAIGFGVPALALPFVSKLPLAVYGVAALVAVFWLAPGSAQVRHTFFDPQDMWQSFIGNPKKGYYSVGAAIWLNIRMFLAAEVLILIVALVIALVRQSTSPVLFPVRVLAVIYVDFFRGVPLLLVIFAVGFGVPALALPFVSKLPLAVYGVAALVLSYSAYVSEVYRAGLNSVHRSQVAAARSLGLSQTTAMRYVILPQAVRNIIPPLLNDFISLQKDTALVGVLGAIEANNAAQIYGSTVFNYSSFTVAAILFLLLTIPLARFTDHLIDRDRRRRLAGSTT
jgi:polar amino acid transport system permease protein